MSIRTKLYLIAVLTFVGFASTFGISLYGKSRTDQALGELLLVKDVKIGLLEARRAEKNFLTRKDVSYIAMATDAVERASRDVRQSKTVGNEILILLKEYLTTFLGVAENMKRQGLTEKEGLTGDLRKSIHEVEAVLEKQNDDALEAMMLMLRRREKDFMLRGDLKYVEQFKADMKRMQARTVASGHLVQEVRSQILQLLDAYEKSFLQYVEAATDIGEKEKRFREVVRKVEPLLDETVVKAELLFREVETASSRMVAIGVTGFGCLSLAFLVLVVRGIHGSLQQLGGMSRKVAAGDLDACHSLGLVGELEDLRKDIANMVDQLKVQMSIAEEKNSEAARQAERASELARTAEEERLRTESMLGIMTEVATQAHDISNKLAASSEELRQRIEAVEKGTQSQHYLVQETATAMEQMNATVLEVARNASNAARGAEDTKVRAEGGAGIVHQAGEAADQAEQQTESMRGGLQELGERADAIGRIMEMITDIADQTNLLALNAAIEAARAGDAGRGFAVVADEVRKLAEKTMSATREVDAVIQGIQDKTKQSITAMNVAGHAVSKSADLAKKAEASLGEIVAIIGATASQVDSIATAAEEQSATSAQITKATEEVNRISVDNTQSLEQVVLEIRHLAELAANLRVVMGKLNR